MSREDSTDGSDEEGASAVPESDDGGRVGEGDGDEGDHGFDFERTVERGFTCTLCGFVMTHEVGLLRADVESVCHNCGDWTTQIGNREELVAAAEEAAAALAGPTLTERQALAYLLRAVMDADREVAAEAMDSTPSNVDNLQRRAAEKVADARQAVDALDALRPADVAASEGTGAGGTGEATDG
ncbi:MAG: hypothetical protein V5A44_05580 [Haloarculaceae archaeon]